MPTYDYHCKSCGYAFEEFHSMSEEPLTVCPKCAKPSLKRMMGAGAGMVFKGTGFYQTDYKNTSSTGTSTSKSASEPPKESKPTTEKKPATEKKPGATDKKTD
jgi:putative FmdB family regulatory protein